jgi:FixJ family two-component response regulator
MVDFGSIPNFFGWQRDDSRPQKTLFSKLTGNKANGIVYIVDDDTGVCDAFRSLFESSGLQARTFVSGPDFLVSDMPSVPSCLLLDVHLRGPGGFVVQAEMRARGIAMPVIFMSGHGDVAMSVKAMKAGAFDFLEKPCSERALVESVTQALDADSERLFAQRSLQKLQSLYCSLTARQSEVMHLIVQGLTTREIASRLSLSKVTVRNHRKEMMTRMQAPTLANLIRKSIRLMLMRDVYKVATKRGGGSEVES